MGNEVWELGPIHAVRNKGLELGYVPERGDNRHLDSLAINKEVSENTGVYRRLLELDGSLFWHVMLNDCGDCEVLLRLRTKMSEEVEDRDT